MTTVLSTDEVRADDGARLAVQVHGPLDPHPSTPTVVLAHGWTLTHASWQPVVDRLVDRGLRVITWDQRGHGGSSLARGRLRGGGLTVRALGNDLAAVLAATAPEGPLVLGGHSMGGMTLMAYAGQHPEAFASRVRGVLFVSTSAGELDTGRSRERRFMSVLARGLPVKAGRVITTRGQRRLLFGDAPDSDHVVLTRDQVASTPLTTMGGFYGALMDHDEREALAVLGDVPVRIIVGDRDRLTPQPHSRRLAEAIPGAELEVVAGAGHMLTYEATDRVVAQLEALLAPA